MNEQKKMEDFRKPLDLPVKYVSIRKISLDRPSFGLISWFHSQLPPGEYLYFSVAIPVEELGKA